MADAPVPAQEPVQISPWADPPPARPAQAPATPGSELFWGLVSTLLLAGWIGLWAGWIGAAALVGGVFVHEFGHLLVINWAGCGPSRIRIIPFFGGAATMSRPPPSEFVGVLIALAGPAFGLLAAVPFYVAAEATGEQGWLAGAFYVGALNLINLLPAAPLDGSKALGPALARIHPLLERAVMGVIAAVALAWALWRGSWLFGAVIAMGALRALAAGTARPPVRRLGLSEWAGAVGLYLAVVGLCGLVAAAAARGAGPELLQFGRLGALQ